MTHESVESARYDVLLGSNFDCCRGESILFVHKEYDQKSDCNENISCHCHEEWYRRPVEAVIKRGNDKHCDKPNRSDRLYDLLVPALLGSRSRIHSPLQELRVSLHEIHSDRERRHEKYSQKHPCLPVIHRPCWNKQQGSHDEKKAQQSGERFLV